MIGRFNEPRRVDPSSGAVSGEVRVSYFDPRTGKPCKKKPKPLHPERHDKPKPKTVWRRTPRAVFVDGERYPSIGKAARFIGVAPTTLEKALKSGSEVKGHEVAYADD